MHIYFPSYLLYGNVIFITFLYEHVSNTISIWICFIHNIFYLEICYPKHFLYESCLSYTFSKWESVIQYIVLYKKNMLYNTFCEWKFIIQYIFYIKVYFTAPFRYENMLSNTFLPQTELWYKFSIWICFIQHIFYT